MCCYETEKFQTELAVLCPKHWDKALWVFCSLRLLQNNLKLGELVPLNIFRSKMKDSQTDSIGADAFSFPLRRAQERLFMTHP